MITTARHRRYMFGAALLLSACNSSADNASTDLAMWTVNATPSLDISGNDSAGDPRIGIAEGVARLANGELVIADRGLTSLRFFSSNGELLRTVGREGEGPGEFRYIAGLLQCSDSLFVHDITRGDPYQVFAFDGSLARSLTFEYVQENTPYRTTCNRDGLFLHMGWERHETMALGRARGTTLYWLADANGKHRASLGEFPGSERLVVKGGTGPHPLGREPVLALSRQRAYIGTADSFAVLSFATDGTPAAMLRYLDTDLRTTPDDIERFKFLDTAGQNTAMQQSLVRMWAGVEYPPTIPAYDQMIVDARDQLWVRRTPRRIGGDAEWIVFAADGTPLARTTMSGELRVYEIGDDYVLGIAVDPTDGTQSVRLHELVRAR